jgi:hypothetical protein
MTEDELPLLEKEWKKQEQEICNFWARTERAKKGD